MAFSTKRTAPTPGIIELFDGDVSVGRFVVRGEYLERVETLLLGQAATRNEAASLDSMVQDAIAERDEARGVLQDLVAAYARARMRGGAVAWEIDEVHARALHVLGAEPPAPATTPVPAPAQPTRPLMGITTLPAGFVPDEKGDYLAIDPGDGRGRPHVQLVQWRVDGRSGELGPVGWVSDRLIYTHQVTVVEPGRGRR